MDKFLEKARSCKIGTMPAMVIVHGSDSVLPGNWIRVKERAGDRWHRILVEAINEDGYFFASR